MLTTDSLGRARLYAILDLGYVAPDDAEKVTEKLIEGGADIIQLRAKKQSIEELREIAQQLHRLTSSANVPLIINDHPEIARDVPVEGLHLGQDDLPIAAAREIVRRKDCWIGKSTHSVAQATAAQAEGADYIGFGPLFATPTKPDTSRSASAKSLVCTSWCSCPSSASAESSWKICRTFSRLARGA